MDNKESSAPAHPSRPEVAAGDPFIAAGARRDLGEVDHPGLGETDECFACYRGVVFLTFEEDGHEWTEPVPCRRCNAQRS